MSRPALGLAPDIMDGILRCNTGGPSSRTRQQAVSSSILGAENGGIPLTTQIALDFQDFDPLQVVFGILERCSIDEPEQLKQRYPMLNEACICREFAAPHPLQIKRASDDEILLQVLWLGLSTRNYYDPSRPVLLTRASLTRQLEYFCGEGFYA